MTIHAGNKELQLQAEDLSFQKANMDRDKSEISVKLTTPGYMFLTPTLPPFDNFSGEEAYEISVENESDKCCYPVVHLKVKWHWAPLDLCQGSYNKQFIMHRMLCVGK